MGRELYLPNWIYSFKWLGNFYYETQTAFGNRAAPAQFDDLTETAVLLTKTVSDGMADVVDVVYVNM